MDTTAAMTVPSTAHAHARDAFSALLQRHRGIVFKVANTYARDPDDRADLAQEIATQLWRAWPGFDVERSVTTWMYRIALNVAISHVRSQSLRRRHDAVALDPDLHDVADANAADHEGEQHLRLLQHFIARQAPLDRGCCCYTSKTAPARDR